MTNMGVSPPVEAGPGFPLILREALGAVSAINGLPANQTATAT